MTVAQPRLWIAILLSVLLHGLAFLPPLKEEKTRKQKPLQVALPPPPAMPPNPEAVPPPTLITPTPATPGNAPKNPPPTTTAVAGSGHWKVSLARQFKQMHADGSLYSKEAIAAGLEGTVLLLIALDEEGKVIGTRIEESSGSTILDRDARAAAMRLLKFPEETPRDIIFPVRFRLRQ